MLKSKRSWKVWWLKPFRLTLQEEKTFSERWQAGFSRLGLALTAAGVVLGIAAVTYVLVALTGLREYIVPGYATDEMRGLARDARRDADSALTMLEQQSQYLEALGAILRGDVPDDGQMPSREMLDSIIQQEAMTLNFPLSEADSLLRLRIGEEDRFALRRDGVELPRVGIPFAPVEGQISMRYQPSEGHRGVDFVAPAGSFVYAVDDGTVLFASYTVDGGYVCMIQHPRNRISVYMHNQSLLHEAGDAVRAGDPIAVIGATGRTAKGPHCHFEWWVDGAPIDPEPWLPYQPQRVAP